MSDDATPDPVIVKMQMPADWKPVFEKRAKRQGYESVGMWLRALALADCTPTELNKLSPVRPRGAGSHKKRRRTK